MRHGSFRRTLFRLLDNGSIVYDLHPRHAHHSLKVQRSASSGHSKPVPTHFQFQDLRKIPVETSALMRLIRHIEKILTTKEGTWSNKQKSRYLNLCCLDLHYYLNNSRTESPTAVCHVCSLFSTSLFSSMSDRKNSTARSTLCLTPITSIFSCSLITFSDTW